jgi:hypothetical protein
MVKTRVGVLLRESIGGNKSTNKSADLTALTQKYQEFVKRLNRLIQALKTQHECMVHMEASRQAVCSDCHTGTVKRHR